ncbi:MAG: tetratricopeptide repeat protein [Lyngbya sp. HA4199-MV5]|jgi:Flp pilus assembly protein TadD|nr:tetratricopeptide repeat protein [Lyngbya sp. HA4199-MV5]
MAKKSLNWLGAMAGVVIGMVTLGVAPPQFFWTTVVLSAEANKPIPHTVTQAEKAKVYVPYIVQGFAFVQERDWKSAERSFRQAIKLGCNEASLYSALGRTLYEQDKLTEAVAAYRKAISLNGNFPGVYNNNLGLALRKQGDLKGAIAAYRKALSLSPNSISPHTNLGDVFSQQGNWEAAIAAYQKAVDCNRNDGRAYTNLGVALGKYGKTAQAVAAYQKAVSLNRNDYRAYTNLGMALYKQGSKDGAIAAFQKARNLYRSRGNTQKVNEMTQLLKQLGSR